MRRPDFGVEARSDESAGRVKANPGKLLWLRDRPLGWLVLAIDLFFVLRSAILFEGFANELFFF